MRHIKLSTKPVELSEEVQEDLTRIFLDDHNKRVWNQPYIKTALLEMTHHKCAYSEVVLGENSSYMEIDHFCPKSLYPDKVVEWGNLVPCCKTCNIKKGNTDPVKISLINPFIDEPAKHIDYQGALCRGLDEKGKNSVFYYDLNNLQFKKPRFDAILRNKKGLEMLSEECTPAELVDNKLRRFYARLETILQSGQPTEPYSVCIATGIKNNPDYIKIKTTLGNLGLWNDKLARLHHGLDE